MRHEREATAVTIPGQQPRTRHTNRSEIAIYSAVFVAASAIAVIYGSLGWQRGKGNLPLSLVYALSSGLVNFLGAILLFQRTGKLCYAVKDRYRDPAYDASVAAGFALASLTVLAGWPQSNDGLSGLYSNPIFDTSGDILFAVNTFTARFVGAVEMLYLFYSKFLMSTLQPNRYFLNQIMKDIQNGTHAHPKGFDQITNAFVEALYRQREDDVDRRESEDDVDGRESTTKKREDDVDGCESTTKKCLATTAVGVQHAITGTLLASSVMLIPLWLHLTQRGSRDFFGNNETGNSATLIWFASAATQLFYMRNFYILLGQLINAAQSLAKEFKQYLPNAFSAYMLLAVVMMISDAIAYSSGSALGEEGSKLNQASGFDSVARHTFLSWMKLYFVLQSINPKFYGMICWMGAALVNLTFIPNILNDSFKIKNTYDVPFLTALGEKLVPIKNLHDRLPEDKKQQEQNIQDLEYGQVAPTILRNVRGDLESTPFDFAQARGDRALAVGRESHFVEAVQHCFTDCYGKVVGGMYRWWHHNDLDRMPLNDDTRSARSLNTVGDKDGRESTHSI
jgi:hypothetical protein